VSANRTGQVLLLDADDTLWENNIYFERAIEHFYALVGLDDRTAVRARINAEEHRVIAEMGYGLRSFIVALRRAFQGLAPERWGSEAEDAVAALAHTIAAEPIELVPEAESVLDYLAPRHRLILMTKGDYAEQTRKLTLSGLAPRFEQVHVVPEKHEAMYRDKLAGFGAPAATCWMIGNSPKSDINPALAAGLNAVFIPHPHTWILEHDEITGPCLRLQRLADLRLHF